MSACMTQTVWARVAALIAVSLLMVPARRAVADVAFLGSVNPDPPAAGGTFSSTSKLTVGDENDSNSADIRAWLSVDDGTLLQYGLLVIGDEEDFFGEVDVQGDFLAGKNTQLNLSGQGSASNPTVQVGNEGFGRITVGGGSTMNVNNQSGNMSIGFDITAVGFATIEDPFTVLTIEDNLYVGQSGIGTLEILNGALVRTLDRGATRLISIGTNPTGVGTVVVDGQGSVLRSASSLVVGGTTSPSPPTELYGQGTLRIRNGGIVDVDNGLAPTINVGRLGRIELDAGTLQGFAPLTGFGTTVNGYLGGSGLVRGSVVFGDDSTAGAVAGQVLRFDGNVSNQGAFTINAGDVRFLRGFTNNAQGAFDGPGRISLENGGVVSFAQTLVNDGVLSSAHGATNIHGEITNQNSIVVARDTVATFHDAVNNTTGTITVKPGGNALFLADLSFIGLSTLQLGVSTTDDGDGSAQVSAGGVVSLGGTLEVTFDGGFTPTAGQSFELISAGGGITGAFDSVLLPLIPQDLELGVHYSSSAVMMEIKLAGASTGGIPGDYNNDGAVDASDYSVWRDKLGSTTSLPNDDTPGVGQDDYSRWKTHFGEVVVFGSGSIGQSPASTPEPTSCLLALIGIVLMLNVRVFQTR